MFADHVLTVIDSTQQSDQLFQLSADLTRSWLNGALAEDDYGRLREAVEARQTELRNQVNQVGVRVSAKGIVPRRRRIPRSPDRIASQQRRRDICQERWLPPNMASKGTPGEIAVLSVIVRQIFKHGVCSLSNAAIAAMAGVCETLVKNAKRFARLMGWIQIKPGGKIWQGPGLGWKSKATRIWALGADLKLWISKRCKITAGRKLATTQTDLERKRDGQRLVGAEPILKVEERGLPIERVVPG
jgi:hypothetical protein